MTKRQVSEGQILKEGEAVAELVIENPLRLWTQVPEQHVRRGPRRPARPGLDAGASRHDLRGTVARINPSVDPSSRTFQVETLVPNKRGLLRPGGLAKASIVTDAQAKAAVVPIESIVHFAGVTKLFLVEQGKARAIDDVKTGVEGRGWVEVIEQPSPAGRGRRHHRADPARRRDAGRRAEAVRSSSQLASANARRAEWLDDPSTWRLAASHWPVRHRPRATGHLTT